MDLLKVEDCDSSVLNEPHDLFICASGYERRSTHLFQKLIGNPKFRALVFGFESSCQPDWRAESDAVFERHRTAVTLVSGDQETTIFEILGRVVPKYQKLRIVIDYSSMPRSWMNAIINFFKFGIDFVDIELLFSYTRGRHIGRASVPEYPVSDYLISRIDSLTTLEGAAVRQNKTLAVVGLGFEWIAPFAACELLEPDEVKVFYANPGSLPDYADRALGLNRRFLDEFFRDGVPLGISVASVESVFRIVAELVAPSLGLRNVALIPLGPKPHVLGCMLVSNRLRDVTCMYVRGARQIVQQVEAVEEVAPVVTKVQFAKIGIAEVETDE